MQPNEYKKKLSKWYWTSSFKVFTVCFKIKKSKLFKFIKNFLKHSSITITSIILTVLILTTCSYDFSKATDNTTIEISIAAIIGTMLALTFTLSIIPIQTLGVAWSPIIANLYKSDRKISLAYITVALLAIVSVLLAIQKYFSPITGVIFLAVTLDILRWYYARVCQLLDPNYGISILKKQIYRAIDNHSEKEKKYTKYNIKFDFFQNKKISEEDFKSMFYQQSSNHKHGLCYVINDLTTITVKGIDGLNLSVAKTALETIKNISCHYLSKRKDNLKITQTLALDVQSDEDNLLSFFYEQLGQIGQYALSKNNESMSLLVCQQYCELIAFIATLTTNSVSIIYMPINYLNDIIEKSQEKSLVEVSFQSSQKILELACKLPNHAQSEIYEPLIDLLYETSLYLLTIKPVALTSKVVGMNMKILHHILSQKNYKLLDETLKYTLRKFKILTPVSILYENKHPAKLMITAMNEAYNLTSPSSLGHLFQALVKIKNEEDSFYNFFEISTHIHRHFNEMARENDFDSNMIVHDIMYSIKHIVELLIYLFFTKSEEDNYENQGKFISEIKCYLEFFTFVFHRKSIFEFYRAITACEILVFIACQLSSANNWIANDIFCFCSLSINSIIVSYCQTQKDPAENQISSLLFYLWNLRITAEKRNLSSSIPVIDEYLSTKLHQLNDEQWRRCLNLLDSEKSDFYKRIDQFHIHASLFGCASSDWFENFFYHLNNQNIDSEK